MLVQRESECTKISWFLSRAANWTELIQVDPEDGIQSSFKECTIEGVKDNKAEDLGCSWIVAERDGGTHEGVNEFLFFHFPAGNMDC